MPARAASECDFAVVHASSIMNAVTKTFQLVCCQKLKPENRICKVEAKKANLLSQVKQNTVCPAAPTLRSRFRSQLL